MRTSTSPHMQGYLSRLLRHCPPPAAARFASHWRELPVIHVAGTKGKGSTCAFVESILRRDQGLRTGVFTSPHLVQVTERFRVDGVPVEREAFAEAFFEVWDALHAAAEAAARSAELRVGAEGGGSGAGGHDPAASVSPADAAEASLMAIGNAPVPGYFRMLTLVGFWIFAKAEVQVSC